MECSSFGSWLIRRLSPAPCKVLKSHCHPAQRVASSSELLRAQDARAFCLLAESVGCKLLERNLKSPLHRFCPLLLDASTEVAPPSLFCSSSPSSPSSLSWASSEPDRPSSSLLPSRPSSSAQARVAAPPSSERSSSLAPFGTCLASGMGTAASCNTDHLPTPACPASQAVRAEASCLSCQVDLLVVPVVFHRHQFLHWPQPAYPDSQHL
mmetsp:Transcript_56608/g.106511  ORF Transcript_56608/g.106511 Transcript_56608/m.106511 type:complete len:210 (-) Transcript_56608:1431-2060(-)